MILADLEIDNYKQFHGVHRFAPPAQGIVGVIGANGAGKTTLFEAIEWCLYNPREIANDEVPPRGGIGATRVKVTLEDPRDGVRYVVERGLKKGAATAEIYREDQPEAPIVQGSKQTAEYVASRLIGLGHRAFVSTFFTRQKELTFFGNMRETERRREVGRLLGLETIRDAQRAIGEERTQARAEAQGWKLQHAEATEGRDFAAETEASEREVCERSEAAEAAETRVAAAGEALLRARGDLERWRELERRDAEFARILERLDGDARVADARRNAAEEDLVRLDELERTRGSLLPLAAAEPAHAAAVAAHEAERERFARQREFRMNLERAEQGERDAARKVEGTVRDSGRAAATVPGWTWQATDAADPAAAAARLIDVAGALDLAGACATAGALSACAVLASERDRSGVLLTKYQARLDQRAAEYAALLEDGDPDKAAMAARRAREVALSEMAQAKATVAGHTVTRQRLEKVVMSLRSAQFTDGCPTCGRAIGEEEAEDVAETLEYRVRELAAEEAHLASRIREAGKQAAALETQEALARQRADRLVDARARLDQGRPMVEEAAREHAEKVEACAEALRRFGLEKEPTPDEVEAAQAEADRLQAVANAVPLLRQLRVMAEDWAAERTRARQALADLGVVSYDEAAHRADEAALTDARAAASRLEEIERHLARRPAVEAEQAAASADLARITAERDATAQERAATGFDRAALLAAVDVENVAIAEERAALDRRTAARAELTEAINRRTALAAEHARIAKLVEKADARARDADALDRMYREFTRFDQYVAERVTPQLAEHTGELLAAVTEGKYDRVEFDENYGLEIFDGADEKFPLEDFSGGERDVAALCARLALSRLVGGQAANPPGFLVLDEVFGSLDRDRRVHVLETLGSLAASTEAFHQLFIISHVDDVRSSPIFDQVWRVNETMDGVSQLQDVTLMSGADDS